MLDMFAKGGLLMWPIVFCSVVALAIMMSKAVQFGFVSRTVHLTPQQVFSRHPELLSPILDAVDNGKAEDEIASVGTLLVRQLERGLGTLSLISAICPLLGLTGTVIGMIQTFQVIASSGSAVNPGMLASGIWEALITTAAGLLVAIPVHVAHHYLDGRMGEIVYTLQQLVSKLIAVRANEV
ncbi:MotA/TolQ/ExbB proton channel family protein [Pseudodesulfovibrio sediminis]|uniref:Flagellar motor protein MotA n=1 Tax=Pseudodesulfovibrio sediminis TaxID=2810563 RepID=A0ABN6EXH7_9BACT|nr:MotA/TolQ/ExbB proton channel family protein [Pseudodesulfovibrio sediminis]BCS89930.1 flagellar motor protein MotA [Pseudodesulfovibrio sediminis]